MPISAIGNPQAADVATALCIDMLNQCKKGTVMVPPAIPITVEMKPMIKPPVVATIFLIFVSC